MVGVFAVLTGGAGGNGAAATGAAAATGGAGGASCVDVFTTCVVVGGPVTGGAGGVGGPVPSFTIVEVFVFARGVDRTVFFLDAFFTEFFCTIDSNLVLRPLKLPGIF